MRLLLVEDDPMIGESVVDGLTDEGYAVDWVQDGHSALLALRTTEFSLVILDLGLPGKDGIKVLEEMRSERNLTPVLVTTARDTVEDRIKGLDAGADDYLIKPFDLDELFARVRALLRRSAGAVLAREQDFRAFTEEGNDKGRNPFDQGRVTRGEYHDAGVPTPVDPFQNLQNDCMHQFRYIHGFTRKYRSVPRAAVERDAQRRDQKRVGGLAHRLARFPGDDRFHSLQTAGAPHQIYG